MPLTVSLGVSKKIGLPNYSSLGATCHVELELESSLLANDLPRFFHHVRQGYEACQQAVEEQLHPRPTCPAEPAESPDGNGVTARGDQESTVPGANGNGQAAGAEVATAGRNGCLSPRASQKQLAFARQLAAEVEGVGLRRLESLAGHLVGKPLADLSRADAAVLIETLKNLRDGAVDLASLTEDLRP